MLTSAIRSRSASVVIGGSDRCSTRWTDGPGPDAWAAAADSRQSPLISAGASSKRIGRAMSATASRRVTAVTSCWRRAWSYALMIINGFLISCAMTVESRPSDDNRSFCDISRWKRAIESVKVLNVVASSRASSSSQRWL